MDVPISTMPSGSGGQKSKRRNYNCTTISSKIHAETDNRLCLKQMNTKEGEQKSSIVSKRNFEKIEIVQEKISRFQGKNTGVGVEVHMPAEATKFMTIEELPDYFYGIRTETKKIGNVLDNELTIHTLCREEIPTELKETYKRHKDRSQVYKCYVRHLKRKYKCAQSLVSILKDSNRSLLSAVPDHVRQKLYELTLRKNRKVQA